MRKRLTNFIKFLVFLGTGVGILYLVYRKQQTAYAAECALRGDGDCSLINKVMTDFAGADYRWLLLVLVLFALSNISRAMRWTLLLEPLGRRPRFVNAFLTIILGYFANLGLPRVGEVIRAGTLARYEHLPAEQVMGTVVVDRIIDVLSMLIVAALAVTLQYQQIWQLIDDNVNLSGRLAGGGSILLLVLAAAVIILLLLYLFRQRLRASPLYTRIMRLARGFVDGLRTVGQVRQMGWLVFHSINIWLMYYLMTFCCFFAFEPTSQLGPLAGLVVFVFGGLGIVIPSPGGMGTYHFLAQLALGLYGVRGDDAFSWANISFFTIQLGCNISIGLLSLLLLPLLNRHYRPDVVSRKVETVSP